MTTTPATILASEVRLMKSKHTGRDYRITISLPYGYAKPGADGFPTSPTKWPVVYLLDAYWYFGVVTDMTRSMAFCGRTTDAIVVGIGYPEADDPQQMWSESYARRIHDFIPVRDERLEEETGKTAGRPAPSGDGKRFHQFIRNELIPLIEKDYRTDPVKRILVGHSSAGLFGTFALLHEPELFDAYVIASPALMESNRSVFEQEEAYSKEHKRLKARVHLSAGEHEEYVGFPMLSDLFHFAAILESRNYEDLILVKKYFANMNHCEVVAPAFHAG
jgi:predicted alpha/beta superfamily hydrolase